MQDILNTQFNVISNIKITGYMRCRKDSYPTCLLSVRVAMCFSVYRDLISFLYIYMVSFLSCCNFSYCVISFIGSYYLVGICSEVTGGVLWCTGDFSILWELFSIPLIFLFICITGTKNNWKSLVTFFYFSFFLQ